eukprot:TRINITY_DN179610_c0_g2_i1.p1 TRINITY_DN179610_c0_g2~~TRINITY_DN179610_c0_g2_i1.p1  ORF type:complete len:146 (+),score=5.49 TRINITY_DN179610_c0_g2_i1:122-559(+)
MFLTYRERYYSRINFSTMNCVLKVDEKFFKKYDLALPVFIQASVWNKYIETKKGISYPQDQSARQENIIKSMLLAFENDFKNNPIDSIEIGYKFNLKPLVFVQHTCTEFEHEEIVSKNHRLVTLCAEFETNENNPNQLALIIKTL